MAEDRVFAAEPDSVVRGGDVTDRISQILERLSHGYADQSSWDASNPRGESGNWAPSSPSSTSSRTANCGTRCRLWPRR